MADTSQVGLKQALVDWYTNPHSSAHASHHHPLDAQNAAFTAGWQAAIASLQADQPAAPQAERSE